MQSAARTYFQTQVSTTTQGDLLIMLFDAALKFLSQAREKILEKNYAQKGILISKALDILSELQASLNAKKGGDLADRLQKLYFFCSARLLAANLKMDVAKIDEVVQILTGLREAFHEANGQAPTKVVPTTATQSSPRLSAPTKTPSANLAGKALYLAQIGQAANQAPPAPMAAPAAPVAPAAQATRSVPTPAAPTPITAAQVTAVETPAAPVVPASALEAVAPPTAAPVRRVMAAYAAGRPQG